MIKLSKAALIVATLGLTAPFAAAMPAFAQESAAPTQAAPFSFELNVPTVTAVDSSMSEDQIKSVFSSDFLSHADQLASLNATRITIPQMEIVFSAEGETAEITYRDIVLENVKDGLAARLTVASGESVSAGETTTYGTISADNFDIKRLLEFAGIVKGDPSAPMKPIYTSGASGGSTQGGPLYSCTFGGSSTGALEARPVGTTLADVMGVIEQFKDADEPPPEALDVLVSYAVDLFRAFRGGGGTVGAIDCTIPGEAPMTLNLAGASTGDFEPGIYPEINVGAISVDAGPLGNGSLGELVFRTLDFNPTLDALESAQGQLSEAWFEQNWRQLIPSWDGMSLSGFAIDVQTPPTPADPATGSPARPSERVQAKIADFDLSLGNYIIGIPTDVSMSASGIEVPLPQDSTDPQIMTLLAAGLTGVNMGFDVAAAWDEAASAINVTQLAMSAVDLGSMSISANLGNATEQLFALDPNVAMASGFALTVKDVTIKVSDDGLGEIVWPLAAAEEGITDVEAYRTQMAGFAEGLAIQLIGPTDAARQLGVALGEFVTGSKGEVTINIKAKNPQGLPMAMFIAAQNDPSILAGQVDITGSAN